ncbi:hypothetical protein RB594_002287 [Gaeumannomyces avenae]
MKVILQRVLSASVTVDKKIVSSIGKGILVLAAVAPGDTEKECETMAAKVLKIRLWDDDSGGRWKHSVKDVKAEVLCGTSVPYLLSPFASAGASSHTPAMLVSQFTLLASTKKGSKPDFHGAMGGEDAKRLYHHFLQKVKDGYEADKVKDGVFQAMMEVALVNDGPVSFPLQVHGGFHLTDTCKQVTLEFNVEPPKPKTPKGTSSAAEKLTEAPSPAP